MKRRVKAWAWQWNTGSIGDRAYATRGDVVDHFGGVHPPTGKPIPCVIEYDDGKPLRKAREAKR